MAKTSQPSSNVQNQLGFQNIKITGNGYDDEGMSVGSSAGQTMIENLILANYEQVLEQRIKTGTTDVYEIRDIQYVGAYLDFALPSFAFTFSKVQELRNQRTLFCIYVNFGAFVIDRRYRVGDWMFPTSTTNGTIGKEFQWQVNRFQIQTNPNNTGRITYSLSYASPWKLLVPEEE